jgi:GNAT superfamily N-acetyltransferase
MEIRQARPTDVERLIELLAAGSLRADKEDASCRADYEDALREIAATPGQEVLVAELDGNVVGTVQLITFRHFQERGGRCAELESMHVHPAHRNSGVGTQLLAFAIARARELGCYRVQLTSNARRHDAHRFYERHGFEATHKGFKKIL